jgi:import inner membrane translocase subunit TIM23
MSRFWRREEPGVAAAPPPVSAAPSSAAFDATVSGKALADSDAFRPPSDMLAAGPGASGRMYSPYAGLAGTFDPQISRALMELPDAPEFVFSEEATVHRRTWSENLTYVTGVAYVAGALAGGAYGAAQGARMPLPAAAGELSKLRLNRVLNAGGKAGRNLGNATGVAGLLYSTLDSLSGHLRGEYDSWNTLLAGAGTGALYKAPAGPRAAAVWGAGGAILGAGAVLANAAVERALH